MQKKYEKLRNAAYDHGKEHAPALLGDPDVRDFVVLYLAEGSRRERNSVAIANQNPSILKVSHRVMASFSDSERFGYSVQYYPDQDPEKLKGFWADQLDIEPSRIKTLKKSNASGLATKSWRSPYGIMMVRVGDTYFRAKLQALMDVVEDSWQ